MTFRVDISEQGNVIKLVFQGLLDREALLHLKQKCGQYPAGGKEVWVVLGRGTSWQVGCLEELRSMRGVILDAESGAIREFLRNPGGQST